MSMSKKGEGRVIAEFSDDGNTYSIISCGKYKEIALVLVNIERRGRGSETR